MKYLLKLLITSALMLSLLYSVLVPAYAVNVGDGAGEAADNAVSDELANVGAGPTIPTEMEFSAALSSLRTKYPHGYAWEGVYYEGGQAKAWTCHAYAVQLFCEIFGVQFYNGGYFTKRDYDCGTICAGDIVRIDYDSHSIFITEVTNDYIYFTDGNSIGYNVVRWDGKYSVSEFKSRFCYKYHISGNTLTGGAPMTHTIAYRPNGGKGSVESFDQAVGAKLTLNSGAFTRDGYTFAGYSVKRQCDATWYTKGHGWQPISAIIDNGYVIQTFAAGTPYSFGSGWVSGLQEKTTFTFYAQWLPNETIVEYYMNESGANYLCSPIENGELSRSVRTDGGVYTLSVDDKEQLNGSATLCVNASAPGGEGKEISFDTLTNYGYYDGYTYSGVIGDNRGMTLGFVAKSSVKGAKMYIRFIGSSADAACAVTLSDTWTRYSVYVPKNNNVGHRLQVYFNKKGSYSLSSMILADGSQADSLCTETADALDVVRVARGGTIMTMPTPVREGYTFLGWYTCNVGGARISPQTPINAMRLRLYAHWRRNISDTPVVTVTNGTHTYELYENALTRDEADAFCRERGGALVSVTNETEQRIVAQMLEGYSSFCWLGLSYDDSSREWRWDSGEPVRRTLWAPGEGSALNDETCAAILTCAQDAADNAGCWVDCAALDNPALRMSYHYSVFICEYVAAPQPTEVVGHRLCGDVDGDEDITIIDATRIQQYLAGLKELDEDQLAAADADLSEDITILDVTMIQRRLAGLSDRYCCVGQMIDLTRVIVSRSSPDEAAPVENPTTAPALRSDVSTEG